MKYLRPLKPLKAGRKMQIQGLQKLTLLDYPEKMAATVFTAGCNFRCPFCHNASLVTRIDTRYDIPVSDVMTFLKKRQNVLEGVCISGGEPLLQPDLEDFIKEVKSLGYLVKLDTNGSNLEKLQNLVEKSLIDYVAMDIKNAPNKYAETIGLHEAINHEAMNVEKISSAGKNISSAKEDLKNNFNPEVMSQVLATVDYLKSGVIPYEFRTTIVREFHKREDIEVIAKWLEGAEKYYLQEFVDSGDLIGEGFRAYTDEIMNQALEIVRKYVPEAKIRGT